MIVSTGLRNGFDGSTNSHVVDPDVAGTIKSNGITTPNVLGVELADGNVLDDDVGNATCKTQALSEKHTLLSITDDGLVALDLDGVQGSLVVLDVNARGIGLIVGAPVILVDSDLASRVGAVRSTSLLGGSSLSASEVESLSQNNSQGLRRSQVVLQLLSGSRSNSLAASTASGLGSEALRFARNRLSRDDRGGSDKSRAQRSERRHTWKMKKCIWKEVDTKE